MQRKQLFITIIISISLLTTVHIYINSSFLLPDKNTSDSAEPEIEDIIADNKPELQFGIEVDSFQVLEGRVQRNQTLSQILSGYNISASVIHQIAGFSRELFDVRRIRQGNNYKVFLSNDSIKSPHYFVYLLDPAEYVRIHLNHPIFIERDSKEVTQVLKEASGTINSSLWNAMTSNQIPPVLAIELSEIYAWAIDFFGLREGDNFRVFYSENYVDSISVGIDKIKSACFTHMGQDFYAIPFEQDSTLSFYDRDGNSLQRTFLKAPLRYTRISSGFSHSRMHPIYRVRMPHHGVDYAAPAGTPVMAIGDGRVIETSYSSGPGRMVRIRHNSLYTSGYMHLRNFASGIRPDVWVKQGDVIGYVGSTGTSTGPHLDFRIWRNGHPVDPLQIESPPVEPVKEENLEAFNQVKEMWVEKLDGLKIVFE